MYQMVHKKWVEKNKRRYSFRGEDSEIQLKQNYLVLLIQAIG